jgi:hypothetical protein
MAVVSVLDAVLEAILESVLEAVLDEFSTSVLVAFSESELDAFPELALVELDPIASEVGLLAEAGSSGVNDTPPEIVLPSQAEPPPLAESAAESAACD